MLRDSSHCAIANSRTTVPASAHSPRNAAPITATIISALMSSSRSRTAAHARRAGKTPPATAAVAKSAMLQASGVTRSAWSSKPEPTAIADASTSHPRALDEARHDGLFVLEPRPHAGFGHRLDNGVGRENRRVIGDAQPLSDDVRGDVLDARERRQPALQNGGFLAAAQPVDAEDRFGVNRAARAGRRRDGGRRAHRLRLCRIWVARPPVS